jgi:hypothetical protein
MDKPTDVLLNAVEQAAVDLSVHPAGCTDWQYYEKLCLDVADNLDMAVVVYKSTVNCAPEISRVHCEDCGLPHALDDALHVALRDLRSIAESLHVSVVEQGYGKQSFYVCEAWEVAKKYYAASEGGDV